MEIFRTLVPVPVSGRQIRFGSKVMFMGSCFSEYIGNKLEENKFTVDNNPFGIVYNPFSIKNGLMRLLANELYTESALFQQNQLWCSFEHHGQFSGIEKDSVLKTINQRLTNSAEFLKTADILFITFGTSYVYELKTTGQVVSNCHKVPSIEFNRRRISVDEIVAVYNDLLVTLSRYNPNLFIVFTVSPIRHWKDGAHENQLSKAILLLAIEEICKIHSKTFYFPSYELVMDDLRDYRFYAEDMLHPNALAIHYIWQRVNDAFMDSTTISIMKEIEKVVQAFHHKPYHPTSDAFQAFARQFIEKIRYLKEQYNVDLNEEDQYFRSFLL